MVNLYIKHASITSCLLELTYHINAIAVGEPEGPQRSLPANCTHKSGS